jgi:hypothetical protein
MRQRNTHQGASIIGDEMANKKPQLAPGLVEEKW